MHVWHMILEKVSKLTRLGVWVSFYSEHNVGPSFVVKCLATFVHQVDFDLDFI